MLGSGRWRDIDARKLVSARFVSCVAIPHSGPVGFPGERDGFIVASVRWSSLVGNLEAGVAKFG